MSSKKTNKNNIVSEKITTIKVLEETKLRLEKLKEHKKESYDNILRKILYVLNVAREDPDKAKRILERISDVRDQRIQEEKEREEDFKKEQKNKDS
ncbi:MAG: hypothetical protein IH845_04045 [Nanoarchaeota archaeon]|nr:hypothetical protein [Nanoarchaeota archaeon]